VVGEVDRSELLERVGVQLKSEHAHGALVVVRFGAFATEWGLEPALMLHAQFAYITLAIDYGHHQNQSIDAVQFFGREDCQRCA
jgi:hypothetical protein